MQMKSKAFVARIFLFLLLTSLICKGVEIRGVEENEELIVDCILVYTSGCSLCYATYEESILPFYYSYQNEETLNFTFIDIHLDIDEFLRTLDCLNINPSNYGYVPWVIFVWGEKQYIVLDDSHLDIIEPTFHAILSELQDNSSDNDGLSLEVLDFSLLAIAFIITISGLFIGFLLIIFCQRIFKTDKLLKRISKRRFILFMILSLVSILVLVYQILDHYQGGCGCGTSDLIEALIFRLYDHINILGFEIPFALIGFGLITGVLIQVFIIGVLPRPAIISIPSLRTFSLSEAVIQLFYYLIVFQMLCAFLSIFYLLYLELFAIKFICLLCTISQLIIVVNTILIVSWDPFP
jgi:hypothetical protein